MRPSDSIFYGGCVVTPVRASYTPSPAQICPGSNAIRVERQGPHAIDTSETLRGCASTDQSSIQKLTLT